MSCSNLNTGKVEYINSGNVAKAVQASSSIPVLFAPVEINGNLYVDGGLMDNVPIKPLLNKCKKIVAVDVASISSIEKVEGLNELMLRIFQMSTSMQEDIGKNCDLLINLDSLSDYWLLDADKKREIFDIGYNYAKSLNVSRLKKKWRFF